MGFEMTRYPHRIVTVLCLGFVTFLTPDLAHAKKKKHGGGGQPAAGDSGGGMTFEPETVEKKDAEPEAAPAPAPKAAAPKQKPRPMTFSPETAGKAGPASKTLERALKLYDAEDYTMSTIELNKVVEGQSGRDRKSVV